MLLNNLDTGPAAADKGAAAGRTSGRKWMIRLSLLVAVLVVADQLVLHLLVRENQFLGTPLAPYATATLQPSVAAELERVRDPVQRAGLHLAFDPELGWEPLPGYQSTVASYDRFGARECGEDRTEEVPLGRRRILAFGCSFTNGTEVADDETWAVRMEAERPELEVFNFGVPAYGLGQALMRMERRAPGLGADEIWLVMMPAAAQRPSTHLRLLVRTWTSIPWLKPRFSVNESGGLARHPNPVSSIEETLRLFDEPGAFNERLAGADPWYDAVRRAFTAAPEHAFFLGRLFWSWRTFKNGERLRGLDGRGDSLVPLHLAIALEFDARVRELGATPRYVILPGPLDLPAPDGDGGIVTAPLMEQLTAHGVSTLDATPAILSVPREERWTSGWHYSPVTNRAVGRWLADQLP
ncbi:MAG: hypothetical protein ACJA2W_002645 [Planctomycetota bacterium]|jgi:hypothetical protein